MKKTKEVVVVTKKIARKVVDVIPPGSKILVEHLTPQEAMGTELVINNNVKQEINQGYIVKLGPTVPPEYEFEVGQRVALQGSFNPLPKLPGYERELVIVDFTSIKAIFVEEEE